jgi:hypothetical protein
VSNRSRVTATGVRVAVSLPRDVRRARGSRKARRAARFVVRLARLEPGATRLRALRLQVGPRLRQRRPALTARLLAPRDVAPADDVARLEYRLKPRRSPKRRARASSAANGLVCVLDRGAARSSNREDVPR